MGKGQTGLLQHPAASGIHHEGLGGLGAGINTDQERTRCHGISRCDAGEDASRRPRSRWRFACRGTGWPPPLLWVSPRDSLPSWSTTGLSGPTPNVSVDASARRLRAAPGPAGWRFPRTRRRSRRPDCSDHGSQRKRGRTISGRRTATRGIDRNLLFEAEFNEDLRVRLFVLFLELAAAGHVRLADEEIQVESGVGRSRMKRPCPTEN